MTTRTITLARIARPGNYGHCKSCGAKICWAQTARFKNIALEAAAMVHKREDGLYEVSSDHVHFANCPQAKAHRRDRRTMPSERID